MRTILFQQIEEENEKNHRMFFLGCTMLFLLVCFVKYNFSLEVDIQELLTGPENPEVLKMLFTNDNFRNAMQLWLPFLDERGFLDTMIKK